MNGFHPLGFVHECNYSHAVFVWLSIEVTDEKTKPFAFLVTIFF